MYRTIELFADVTLRCIRDERFKHGVLSIQFLRPMCAQEAALNALFPEVLLRGCQTAPDLRQITARLDDLYGASVGTQLSRIGDCQTTGLSCAFLDDRFAADGDRVLEPMTAFLSELLLHPILEKDGFCAEYVCGEKRNLISALEARRNDKQAYATEKLLKNMCKGDSLAVPRLGKISDVRRITPHTAFEHYQTVLRESPVEIFYVGSAEPERVAELVRPIFAQLPRAARPLPLRSALVPAKPSHRSETMQIAQAKLAMGFVTPITIADPRYAAMQVCNNVFGAGQTSKLFMKVREERSLCYAVGSSYYGAKGVVTAYAGVDTARVDETREAILEQLAACRRGEITERELAAAKEGMLSGLRAVYDSPESMRSFFSVAAIGGLNRTPQQYAEEIRAVRVEDVVAAADTLQFHSDFVLKGALV